MTTTPIARWSRLSGAVAALVLMAACGNDAAEREHVLESAPAQHLVGVWDATLKLERPIAIASSRQSLPRSIAGTVSFLESRHEHLTFTQMGTPTHVGVYDLDFRELGFPTSETGDAPLVVARTVHRADASASGMHADSVYVVLNPGTSRYALILTGAFSGDSVLGAWTAESFLGGGGVFVLRHHGTHGAERQR